MEATSPLSTVPKKEDGDSGDQDAPLSRRERKKAALRKQLADVAMDLFKEQGFSETTVEQITDRVDVSPATFFNYFPSKEAVLADYHRTSQEKFMAKAQELEGKSARERFLELAVWQEERAQREGRLFKILLQEFLSKPAMLEQNRDTAMVMFEMIVGWVESAKQQGEVRDDVDSLLVVKTILGIWNSAMLEWAAGGEAKGACCGLRDRMELLFDGLTSRE
jgi:AcrR family transcriptional regulator